LAGRSTHKKLDDDMAEFAEWDSFYVIVGSAAGALIGLQFVVMTLIADRPPLRAAEAGAAFATPNIVHFAAALFLSALLLAPWHTITIAAALWGLIGIGGAVYTVVVARRVRRQTAYQAEFEDWLFHVVLPLAAYAILALSPFAAPYYTRAALFGVGAAALLVLFIGIHNTWDALTYHVFAHERDRDTKRS
jgi:predicted membrane-bound spermidine synthase